MKKKLILLTLAFLLMSTSAAFAVVGAAPPPEGMMGIMAVGTEPAEEGMATITSVEGAPQAGFGEVNITSEGSKEGVSYPLISGILLVAAAGGFALKRKCFA
ncbi:MAG: hypothetical protein ACOY9Y_14850 [Bacillota bacterium]